MKKFSHNLVLNLLILFALPFIFSPDSSSLNAQTCPGKPFFDYNGGNLSFNSSDSLGKCYDNLVAGQTYCFSFRQPANGYIEMDINLSGCSTCPTSMYGIVSSTSSIAQGTGGTSAINNGGCITFNSSNSACTFKTYDPSCNLLTNGAQFGKCSSLIVGQVYTICFTVPQTCGGMSICPLYKCFDCSVNPTVTTNGGAICAGSCFNLSASATAGTGPYSYSWLPNIGNGAGPFSVCPTSTTTYTVTSTDVNGLTATDTATVVVNPLPSVTAGSGTSICQGSSTNLSASGGVSYSWSPSTGLDNPNVANPTATPSVTTTYTVSAADANGCSNTATVTVTVSAPPVLQVSPDVSICPGSSTTLSASGATTYSWSPAAGLSNTAVPNPVASPSVTTTYTVTGAIIKDCATKATVTVTVNSLPVIKTSPDTNICKGSGTSLTASGGVIYSWSPSAGLSSTTIANPVASPAVTTVYTVTGTDANGCSNSASLTVKVKDLPVVTVSPNATICNGLSTTLNASGGVTYSWSPAAGLSNPAISNPVASPSVTTTYTVTVGDASGCSNTGTVKVSIGSSSVVTISSTSTIGCDKNTIYIGYGPQSVTLTANTSGSVSSYQWYVNGSAIPGGTSQSIAVVAGGLYNVIIADGAGCKSDSANTKPVTINVVDIRCGNDLKKVTLCHVPDGNSGNPQTLCIPVSAVQTHLKNHPGDCLGSCPSSRHRIAGDLRMNSENGDDAGLKVFPNPFTAETVLEFYVSETSRASLTLFDIKGGLVEKLFDGLAESGNHYTVKFDGSILSEGIYFATLISGNEVIHQRLILTK